MSAELFEQLVIEHRTMLWYSALKMMKNKEDAEDVLQNALFKGYKYRDAFDYRSTLGSWLYRILVNEVGLWYRRRHSGKWNTDLELSMDHLFELESLDKHLNPDVICENKYIRMEFERVLEGLPSKQKDAALLHFGLGYTVKEITGLLNRTETSVKSSLHQSRKKLKKELAVLCV
jgi:RNA polymerase sigma-70 factor (ECF subfamily)